MTRFQDRVAIVTGADAPDGIGAAVARALDEEGARVVLGAMSERVHQRAAELGPAAVGVVADLTVDGAANALVQAALERWDRIDVLVNNAGMTSVTSGWDAADDVARLSMTGWNAALARNLTTSCAAAVTPAMTAAGYGRIVSIGSTTGTVNAMPGQATYTAAKGGLGGAVPRSCSRDRRQRRHRQRRGPRLCDDRLPAGVRGDRGRCGSLRTQRNPGRDRGMCPVPDARVGIIRHRIGVGRRRRARSSRDLAAPLTTPASAGIRHGPCVAPAPCCT
ncbi:SDR family oxidoreductase [Streptomyces sp. NBC_01390]